MKKITGIAMALALVTVPAGQALAGWKLVSPAKPATIGKSTLSVTAGEEWNRNTYRPIKKAELWTLDGLGLNELYFVTGLIAGEPLYRELDKKNKPLPKLGKAESICDLVSSGATLVANQLKDLGGGWEWLTVPLATMIAWVFHTMDKIGDVSENPFEGGPNDIPITTMSRAIEIDLRDLANEKQLPEAIKPSGFIQM